MYRSIWLYFLCSMILGSSTNYIMYNGQFIEENTIIIKFKKEYAPLLGKIKYLDMRDIFKSENISHFDKFKQLEPLFKHIENFTDLHYKHELHQFYKLTLYDNNSFNQIISNLKTIDSIDNVELNSVAEALLIPNDELYSNQWPHDNQRQAIQFGTGDLIGTLDCDLDTDAAWDITLGNPDVIIAIVDTGVDLDHPDLIANIVPGYNFINEDLAPDDEYDHGTPCAGIAAATINNDIGIAGVCPECSIMSVKVLDDNGFGDWGVIANGVVWASDNGADVISLSLGGAGFQEALESAVNYSVENGSVTIAASGNINTQMDFYPASYEQCIAVGAISPCNQRKNPSSCDGENYWGSTYGEQIDVVAPGVRIFSTGKRAGYWTEFNGTSSACPHVAGIAGLMLSYDENLNPQLIRDLLAEGADDIGQEGYDIETGHGRVNAYNSLMLIPSTVIGDLNLDGEINISDILILLESILSGDYNMSGDMNGNGSNNISDIMLLIQIILN